MDKEHRLRWKRGSMKKPVVNPSERNCPECQGAGFTVVPHPKRPAVQLYQVCKECSGKGRVAAN
jgi:DnaJ-class molecular chaperone